MGAPMQTGYAKALGNERFTDGFYSSGMGGMWANYPALAALNDPFLMHDYSNDFHDYTAADWIITTVETSGGNATEVLADEIGGVLLVTNDDGDNEEDEFQKNGEAYKLAAGKPLWFEAKIKISDATESDLIVGLCITDTTAIAAVTDGVYFLKDDDDTNIDYHCEKNSTDTSGDTSVDIVAATYNRYGIHFDGAGTVSYWLDGVQVASSTTNIPDDEELCITFGLMNGTGAAKTLSIDYIRCVQVR